MHVVVIGAGIVGVASAIEAQRDGHQVTLLDAGLPGGEQAASYGNGCWLSPASVIPMSMPGLWKKVPGYLTDPSGPLVIRWSKLVKLMPWLLRFLDAGSTVPKVEATAQALSSLLRDAPARHAALAEEAGCAALIRPSGLIYAYPSKEEFLAEALAWRLRRDNGLAWQELEGAALAVRLPDLDPRYRFAVVVEAGAHCADPGAYVAALAESFRRSGGTFQQARAYGFSIAGGRLQAVETSQGPIPCDKAVIAAGIGSKLLARAAGDAIPLESERGYHVVIANPPVRLETPLMPSDGKMALTMTPAGLRVSGQVELASVGAEPDWRRAEILLDHALSMFPALRSQQGRLDIRRWMGHRPSTPDGRPVFGHASASPDIIHAFGHGHIGLATGAISGRIAADLVTGARPVVDLAPFAPTRF